MKKKDVWIILILAAFLMPALALAVETEAENATDKTLAALETSQDASAGELLQDEEDAFKEDSATDNVEAEPIATVSDAEKTESTGASTKDKKAPAEPRGKKASSSTSTRKSSKPSAEAEGSSALNTAEMQRRWKALFSKEIAPDSIAYTVKSGDSLYVLARKNHTTVDFIKKINGLKSDDIYPKMKLKIHKAPFSIQIDKSKNTLVLYSDGEPVKKYSVATGKKNCTPVGEFKITDKLVNPTWFKTGAILPPGSPENALGTRWMGFDKPSYGIHGTIEPKSIGSQASEGCIRMLNEEVEELYSIVPVGTKVTVQD